MKNILLITSLYPSKDIKILNNTAVCHYFAKEWKNMGYNVRVIFCYHCYPFYYYPLLKILAKFLANKAGIAVMTSNSSKISEYTLDGIKVSRIPIKKNRPGGHFSKKEIAKLKSRILNILANENYRPDIILGHFTHPSVDVVSRLKEVFTKSKTAVTIHGKEEKFETHTQKLLFNIDYIGYRSLPIKNVFESLYGYHSYFMCPSGVPQEYIIDSPRIFRDYANRFVYVGAFMKRKYPSVIVPAVHSVYGNQDYSITFIGDGNGKNDIVRTAKKVGNLGRITFTGRLQRDAVKAYLDIADVFIMISKLETFGLVYLEAMARGCIVVASKNEGMEGIIVNGKNGFLCEAGNERELAKIIGFIKGLSLSELSKISEAGRQTAIRMTDKIVAKEYIDIFN